MKIRNGFVSNSSTSSFICDICGKLEAGQDMSLWEFDMHECEKHHVFCIDHVINKEMPSEIKLYDGTILNFESYDDIDFDDFDYIPSIYCPICQMHNVSLTDLKNYAFKKLGSQDLVEQEIKTKFKSYDDLNRYLMQN